MTDPVPSKELFPGEPTAPWDRKDLAGPPLNEAAWNYELRSYYERWQRGAREEIENLRRENVRWENAHKILLSENERFRRPAHEREPPHCASCACGMEPEQPNAIRALWNKAVIVQDGNRATVAFETADEAEAAFDYIHQLGSIAQTTEGGR